MSIWPNLDPNSISLARSTDNRYVLKSCLDPIEITSVFLAILVYLTMLKQPMYHACQLFTGSRNGRFGSKGGSDWPQTEQIRDFFRSDFSTYGAGRGAGVSGLALIVSD